MSSNGEPHHRPQMKVEWNLAHLRLLHNAVSFYMDNRVELLKKEEELKEPTEYVFEMKQTLDRMILEFNFHSQQADADCE